MPPRTHAIALAAALLLACTEAGAPTGGPQVVTETRGDTTVVRTLSGSVWGGDATRSSRTSWPDGREISPN